MGACAGVIVMLLTCACHRPDRTPALTMQAIYAAAKNKDVAAYKHMLARGKLADLEAQAQQSDMSTGGQRLNNRHASSKRHKTIVDL